MTSAPPGQGLKRACIVGWPVAHSRSPLIHGHWLARYGIVGSYERAAVKPEDAVDFLRHLGAQGYVGCNVTIPYKETAFAVADVTLPAARAAGAANTLWFEGDRLMADNTDGTGFVSNMRATVPGFAFDGAVVQGLQQYRTPTAVHQSIAGQFAGRRDDLGLIHESESLFDSPTPDGLPDLNDIAIRPDRHRFTPEQGHNGLRPPGNRRLAAVVTGPSFRKRKSMTWWRA